MKKYCNKKIVIISSVILLLYSSSIFIFGNHSKIIKNKPANNILTKQPNLKDNYYNHINYEFLKENHLKENEAIVGYNDIINLHNIEINKIIDDIIKEKNITNPNDVKYKIQKYYNELEEIANGKDNIKGKLYIDEIFKKVDNVNNIKDLMNIVYEYNNLLEIDMIYVNNYDSIYEDYNDLNVVLEQFLFNIKENVSDKDLFLDNNQYSITNNKKMSKFLRYYGFTSNEAYNIIKDVKKLYKEIAYYSLKKDRIEKYGNKIISINELQKQIKNININIAIQRYKKYLKDDYILVKDITQLKKIDELLTDKNLDKWKSYIKYTLVENYGSLVNSKIFNEEYKIGLKNNPGKTKEDYIKIEFIKNYFEDTIAKIFYDRNINQQQIEFYNKMIKDELEILKSRILKKDWLEEETKLNAIKKLDNMKFSVAPTNRYNFVENKYVFTDNLLFDTIDIFKQNNNQCSYMLNNRDFSFAISTLDYNCFYLPSNNSIHILMPYIYAYTKAHNYDKENPNNTYFKSLGQMGWTIGHEITHALDSNGAKYDENGYLKNWWTEKDYKKFYEKCNKIIKYYNKYEQFGRKTLGEDIADNGGMAIIMDLAKKNNATKKDYKTIFEAVAKDFCYQKTKEQEIMRLYDDEHSKDINRVNAVLSSTDQFYEIYDIKKDDKMYVPKEDRIGIW